MLEVLNLDLIYLAKTEGRYRLLTLLFYVLQFALVFDDYNKINEIQFLI